MTAIELLRHLEEALARGLPSDTTVVVSHEGWYSTASYGGDPSDPDSGPDMWFTIEIGEPADCRWTPGGMPSTDD